MSVLIIHPQDPSTHFLKPICATIQDKTVITGGVTKYELRELIKNHDRIIMLGHGNPNGLLSVGQFPDAGFYIIDYSFCGLLSAKKENIFIWCHANIFGQRHRLYGLYTGMFISEVIETFYCDLWDVDMDQIEESNRTFASVVSRNIDQPLNVLYENVLQQEYGQLAETNPIAKYNLERLYFSERKMNSCINSIGSRL